VPRYLSPVLDTEIVIAVCCAIVVAAGLFRRDFGAPETLALLGLAFSLRLIAGALFDAWRARLPRG
jgi:hypothetical protein